MRDLFILLRPQQWYKNIVVVLPLLFGLEFLDATKWIIVSMGFLALCLISSGNYVINDLLDIERDKAHPEKKLRPLASGTVSTRQAKLSAVLLLCAGLSLAYWLSALFAFCGLLLFVLTFLYSVLFKHEPFADIIMISWNFVIRAGSGAWLIGRDISSWLVVGTFFLALFLATGKRHADAILLGTQAEAHKRTLGAYTHEVTNSLMIISTSMLVFTYTLYTFLSSHQYLIATIPFPLYCAFRYSALVQQGSVIARHPERAVFDVRLMVSLTLWVISTVGALYYFGLAPATPLS